MCWDRLIEAEQEPELDALIRKLLQQAGTALPPAGVSS